MKTFKQLQEEAKVRLSEEAYEEVLANYDSLKCNMCHSNAYAYGLAELDSSHSATQEHLLYMLDRPEDYEI